MSDLPFEVKTQRAGKSCFAQYFIYESQRNTHLAGRVEMFLAKKFGEQLGYVTPEYVVYMRHWRGRYYLVGMEPHPKGRTGTTAEITIIDEFATGKQTGE